MSATVFYAAERARWPELRSIDITDAWAERALRKLVRHFHLDRMPYQKGPVPLMFARAGSHTSWGGVNGITLAASRDWLIFLHEVAHVWEYRKHGRTDHRKRLARFVDRLCRYAVKMGWPQADLDEQFETWAQTQAEHDATEAFTERAEAELNAQIEALPRMPCQPVTWPEPRPADARAAQRSEKIEHREAQLARLERKIKALTTRAKKVRRSLNALRRAQTPHTTG